MTHVAIIGGGIAGPVAALALQQAGISAAVYEAYDTGADDVGAFLTVAVNGLDALRAINAHQPVIEHSFPAPSIEIQNGRGRRLGSVPLGNDTDTGPRTLTRAGLYRVLHDEAARRGIAVEHGKRLVHVTTGDGVTASFADGTKANAHLLIGADGLHSTTRTLIDPKAPAPRALGWHTVSGYTPQTTVAQPDDAFRMIYGKRALFAHVTAPNGHTWWVANIPGVLTDAELAHTTRQKWKQRLTRLFATDNTPAVDIIQAATDLVPTNTYDLPSTPTWHNSAMVIIGDAAHATAPPAAQGASMAIEDAVTLAKCLRDLPSPQHAFTAYERLRRDRVERVVAIGASRMGTHPPTGWRRLLRDRALTRTLKHPRPTNAWLRDHHIDWESPITTETPAS